MSNWDQWFLAQAYLKGLKTKDQSGVSRVGAIIVRPDHTEVASGYAGFPRRLNDDTRVGKDEFSHLIIHAELNAMHMCREDITGHTLYTYNRLVCPKCFPHVAQRGIKRIVGPWPTLQDDPRGKWRDRGLETIQLAEEAGINVTLMNLPDTITRALEEAAKHLRGPELHRSEVQDLQPDGIGLADE